MNEPIPHPPLSGRRWTLAHALVFGLVGLIAAALGALRPDSTSFADAPETRLIVVLGAILTSLVQGRFLRQQVPGWARASLLGAALGAGLALLGELALPDRLQGDLGPVGLPWSIILPVLWAPCLALGMGLSQGRVMRRCASGAGSWVGASLLSWSLSLPAAFIAYNVLSLPIGLLWRSPDLFEFHRMLMTALFWFAFGAALGFLTLTFLEPRLRAPTQPPFGGPAALYRPAPDSTPQGDLL
jgi:hypothetical protein